MQEFPQSLTLTTLVYMALASILGWLGHWFKDRKRQPHEIAKISAETRQISINTDVSLIQAATTAITKAERLQQERDHWERKATDSIIDLEEAGYTIATLRDELVQVKARLRNKTDSLDKAMGLLKFHNISYAELDQPKS